MLSWYSLGVWDACLVGHVLRHPKDSYRIGWGLMGFSGIFTSAEEFMWSEFVCVLLFTCSLVIGRILQRFVWIIIIFFYQQVLYLGQRPGSESRMSFLCLVLSCLSCLHYWIMFPRFGLCCLYIFSNIFSYSSSLALCWHIFACICLLFSYFGFSFVLACTCLFVFSLFVLSCHL